MQKTTEETVTNEGPLALRWHRLQAAYRFCNLATHHVLGFTVKLVLLLYFGFAVLFVALRDRQGAQVLALPSVQATLSWWSVLGTGVRFESLELIRPDLAVRRDPDGKLYAAGVYFDPAKPGDGKGADWLLSQREIVIREGRLAWADGLRGTPPLVLDNVNLLLRNQWRRHQFAIQATPPAALSAPLDVRADFVHPAFSQRISDLSLWKGEIYADLRRADLAAWKTYLDYPLALSSGSGSLRAWVSLDQAKLAGFTADVGLTDLAAVLGPDLPALDLAQVSGRVSAREEFAAGAPAAGGKPAFGTRGHRIELAGFSLTTRDGMTLAPTSLSEHYVAAVGQVPEQTDIHAQLLDLQTLAGVAERLPLSASQRKLLADFAPRGRLVDFSAQWQGTYPALHAYHIQGQLAGLGMKAQPPRAAVAL